MISINYLYYKHSNPTEVYKNVCVQEFHNKMYQNYEYFNSLFSQVSKRRIKESKLQKTAQIFLPYFYHIIFAAVWDKIIEQIGITMIL